MKFEPLDRFRPNSIPMISLKNVKITSNPKGIQSVLDMTCLLVFKISTGYLIALFLIILVANARARARVLYYFK